MIKELMMGLFVIMCFVIIHESTHVVVAHNFDCKLEASGFEFDGFVTGFFVRTSCPASSVEMQAAYRMAQSNVDSIGYQVGILLCLIFLSISILGIDILNKGV